MIKTYDWIFYAYHHPDYKQQIEDIIFSGKDCELVYENMCRMKFDHAAECVTITALSADSPFYEKIYPKEISYSAVLKIMNGTFDSLSEDEFRDLPDV